MPSQEFVRGMNTAGTVLENPFPSLDEYNGQQFAKIGQGQNNGTAAGGGGGGAALILIALLVFIVPVAIAAVPGALILIFLTWLLERRSSVDFSDAYKATFIGLLLVAGLGMGSAWLFTVAMPELPSGAVMSQIASAAVHVMSGGGLIDDGYYVYAPVPPLWAFAAAIVLLHGAGLSAFAVVLRWNIGGPYDRRFGFLLALMAAALVSIAVLAMSWLMLMVLAPVADPLDGLGGIDISSFALPALISVAGAAILGSFILAPLLMAAAGKKRSALKFGPAYRISLMVLALASVAGLIAFYLFRSADGAVQVIAGLVLGWSDVNLKTSDAIAFVQITAPGAFAGAIIVAMNLFAYRGPAGFLKSSLLVIPAGICSAAAAIAGLFALSF